ncbi:hypothetical protein ZHAS_00006643 [Anopheles sinensis]|uniref:Uncharacterized protein n=1 Tax=Anopheles sinensis TaxID=74873 RepID=A0A084VMU6_ANOSI|nr:hypothetical protein ZHAS_00006643 [Anopheles sinensis]
MMKNYTCTRDGLCNVRRKNKPKAEAATPAGLPLNPTTLYGRGGGFFQLVYEALGACSLPDSGGIAFAGWENGRTNLRNEKNKRDPMETIVRTQRDLVVPEKNGQPRKPSVNDGGKHVSTFLFLGGNHHQVSLRRVAKKTVN